MARAPTSRAHHPALRREPRVRACGCGCTCVRADVRWVLQGFARYTGVRMVDVWFFMFPSLWSEEIWRARYSKEIISLLIHFEQYHLFHLIFYASDVDEK